MYDNADLIAPMLAARKNLQDDVARLLELVAQRRKALSTLDAAISTMRALPGAASTDEAPEPPARAPKQSVRGAPRMTRQQAADERRGVPRAEQIVEAAVQQCTVPGWQGVLTSRGLLAAMRVIDTPHNRTQVNAALKCCGLFELVSGPTQLAQYRPLSVPR